MLSSNTLFHYTSSRSALLSILRETFWPNFCLETLPFEEDGFPPQNGTPMVCFCDIPLSAARDHMEKYGRYALGLSKSWGIENGVSPVLYTHSKSPLSLGLKNLMSRPVRSGKGILETSAWDELYRVLAFTKEYSGVLKRNGVSRGVRYYDEREWRWVPQELPPSIRYGIDSSEFVDGRAPEALADLLRRSCRLSFDPCDIRYIVVASEDEIVSTVADILEIKQRFSHDEKVLLTTRVISAQQIADDF